MRIMCLDINPFLFIIKNWISLNYSVILRCSIQRQRNKSYYTSPHNIYPLLLRIQQYEQIRQLIEHDMAKPVSLKDTYRWISLARHARMDSLVTATAIASHSHSVDEQAIANHLLTPWITIEYINITFKWWNKNYMKKALHIISWMALFCVVKSG